MRMDSADKKFVMDAWSQEFPTFTKSTKFSLLRLNGFCLVGIDLGLDNASSYYRIIVSTHLFFRDDFEARYYDKDNKYDYSLGQHGRRVRAPGQSEEFSALCDRIKSETAAKNALKLQELISYLKMMPSNTVFKTFSNIEAICVANFFLGGIDLAVKTLEEEAYNFSLWPEATRAMLGGSWPAWRDRVIKNLDKERIERNKGKFLEYFKLDKKLTDYGL